MIHAVGLRASDAHSNPLEGLRVEWAVLGILDLPPRGACWVQVVVNSDPNGGIRVRVCEAQVRE